MYNETIAAIGTAAGNAGIGVIRISGPESYQTAGALFPGKNLEKYKPGTFHVMHIPDVDEVVVLLFRAPHSYTGEDVVEIQCHGGSFLCRKILDMVYENGARPAEPGEFTKRAFLSGRMDLSQAEAVMDLIEAKNRYAARAAIDQLEGSVRDRVRGMRAEILHHTAYIEAALDDPEHITLDGYGEILGGAAAKLLDEIDDLIAHAEDGRILKEGIQTVIVGKPNVGKSTLLNALLGRERAIVTDIPGTTRDSLEEQIILNGIQLNLVDTAGIRESADTVEKIGIDRSLQYAKEADLVLFCLDCSCDLTDEDRYIMEHISDKKGIVLLNKSDLDARISQETIAGLNSADWPVLDISAKDGDGLDRLADSIQTMFFTGRIDYNDQIFLTNLRHKNCLNRAKESLKELLSCIELGLPEDFYTIDMKTAYDALGEITGDTAGEDLVNEIFSKFCLGK